MLRVNCATVTTYSLTHNNNNYYYYYLGAVSPKKNIPGK